MARDRDDEYEDRPSRRRDRDQDDIDDYADDPSGRGARRGPVAKGMNVCGLIALILGVIGLVLALIPCIGVIGIPIAAIGLLLGVIGLLTAGKTTGRGLPIAGTCASLAGLIIASAWLAFFAVSAKKVQDDVAQMQVTLEKEAQRAEENRKLAEKELREGKAVTVTAKRLDDDYDDNPINADTKYKNKVLEVSGVVDKVNRDRFGKAWIEFRTDSDAIMKCEFPKESQNLLEKIEANKNITIRGRCKGKARGRDGDDEIILENCILVTKTAP